MIENSLTLNRPATPATIATNDSALTCGTAATPAAIQIPSTTEPRRVTLTWNAAGENVGVARCCLAYERARIAALEQRKTRGIADEIARKAFKEALPALSGRRGIGDFVACIAVGSLMDVFTEPECRRLLYAAQVAQGATDRPPRRQI